MAPNMWEGKWNGRTPLGDTHRRAREVISSSELVRGKFPSRKNGRMVQHEGLLELDAIYLFETSPRIVRYREQPRKINYPDGERLRHYTPDFELVLLTGEVVLIEVKPAEKFRNEEIQHKFDRIKSHMHRLGLAFVILTDEHIRVAPRLANLRWIYHRASRVPPTAAQAWNQLTRYQEIFPTSFEDSSSLLKQSGGDPYSLLMLGLLCAQFDAPFSLNAELNVTRELDHDWFFITEEYGF